MHELEMQHDLAIFDSLANKLLGPNGKCKPNTIIPMPDDAIKDDLTEIVQARIGLV